VSRLASGLRTAARAARVRPAMEEGLDFLRLQVDAVSDPAYQPASLPSWRHASREDAVHSRWQAMQPVLDELRPATALDIGCNAAWFPLQLAERGIPSVGVEGHAPYFRTAAYAVRRSGRDDVGLLQLSVSPRTVELLPHAGCVLLLSVWHHLVRDHGLDGATGLLSAIWERCGSVLFFETAGDEEMPASFGLPRMEPDARTWVERYLGEVCAGAELQHLGGHRSGEPEAPVLRDLFAVVRIR